MFCKMIAKDFKKLEGKWTYKVFMVGGAVFYEAPCTLGSNMDASANLMKGPSRGKSIYYYNSASKF